MPGLRETLRREDVGPIIRRFFINTLFDSTFMLLGIVVGAAFATYASLGVVITTMVASSLALGISTGVSVYEAESLERERRISELERALFRDLSGTTIEKAARSITMLAALINFLTPLFSCALTISPFVLVTLQVLEINSASWFSVVLALSILFCAGVFLGRLGKKNPWMKGFRMVCFGLLAFIIGFLLNYLI
ncbi:MAG: VIT1/CCC1 transporter family protein [Candidatus Bathycorpusculaceae bacterium]